MADLKKIAVGFTAGVWASALGSAVAVAFVLNRPPVPRIPTDPETAHVSSGQLEEAAPVDPLLDAPVTPAHRVLYSRPAPLASVVDIEQMRCDEWRDLQMGSGRVQVCSAPEPLRSSSVSR